MQAGPEARVRASLMPRCTSIPAPTTLAARSDIALATTLAADAKHTVSQRAAHQGTLLTTDTQHAGEGDSGVGIATRSSVSRRRCSWDQHRSEGIGSATAAAGLNLLRRGQRCQTKVGDRPRRVRFHRRRGRPGWRRGHGPINGLCFTATGQHQAERQTCRCTEGSHLRRRLPPDHGSGQDSPAAPW